VSNIGTANIIIKRWKTLEIFEGIDNVPVSFAQGDVLDLAFVIEQLQTENIRLKHELNSAHKESSK
jgi:hypothetical protein